MTKKLKNHWNEKWEQVSFGKATKGCTYEISNYGRIKSIDKASGAERELKGAIVNRDFKILNVILKDGSHGYVYVHKFVAEHFVSRPSPEHTVVVHKDYDKSDNKWTNLKWITEEEWKSYLENKPGYDPEKYRYIQKSHYKLNETKVRMIKRMLARGKVKREVIARNFGVAENTIYQIQRGIRWGHVKIEEEEN